MKKTPKLTVKKAKEIALKVLGTSKGLTKDPYCEFAYEITMGDFCAAIRCAASGSSLIEVSVRGPVHTAYGLYNPDTLEEAFQEEEMFRLREKRDIFEEWVCENGPEPCKAEVDRIWYRNRG